MLNLTNITSTVNTSLSYNITGSTILASIQTLKIDSAHHVGYGLGKIVRAAFDHLYLSWQKMWTQEPTTE